MSKKSNGKNGKRRDRHMKRKALRRALRAMEEKGQDFRDALLEEGLILKPWKGKNPLMINEKYIVCPKRFKRHGKDDFSDLKNVAELDPIEVVKLPGEKLFVIVNGGRRFRYQRQENKKAKRKQVFKCTVQGIAESRTAIVKQIAKGRLEFRKDATSLEQAQVVLSYSERLHKDYPGQIRGHGGPPGKISEVKEIQKHYGLTNRAARYLLNFGKHLGMDALLGLAPHGLNPTSGQIENLVKQGIAEETGKKIAQSLKRKEKALGKKLTAKEREEIAGKIAYPIFKTHFGHLDPPNGNGNGRGDDDHEDDGGGAGAGDGAGDDQDFTGGQPRKSIDAEGIARSKELMEPAKAQFEALVEFVRTKEEFSEEDTEDWFAQKDVFERAYAKWLVHMAIKGILKSKKGKKRQ